MNTDRDHSHGVVAAAQALMLEADKAHQTGAVPTPWDYVQAHIDRAGELTQEVERYIQRCYAFRAGVFL